MIKVHSSSVRLTCDGCGVWHPAARSANAAVYHARKGGWSTGKGRDLCPTCRPAQAVTP